MTFLWKIRAKEDMKARLKQAGVKFVVCFSKKASKLDAVRKVAERITARGAPCTEKDFTVEAFNREKRV